MHPCDDSDYEIQMASPGSFWPHNFLPCSLVRASEPLFPRPGQAQLGQISSRCFHVNTGLNDFPDLLLVIVTHYGLGGKKDERSGKQVSVWNMRLSALSL